MPDEAAIYLRYSSDQSNPRSLDQQLRLTLERAKSVGHFVPWWLVFADSGVTGTITARRGYQMLQAAFSGPRPPKALYFDDLSRLSRDMAASTQFCRALQEAGARVLGASDGFDSAMDQYKAILGVSGLVHEFYIDGLKKKVDRGMADAFRQGKNVRPAAFGYHLVPVTTADGKPILNRKRQQQRELQIHEEQAGIVQEIFRRYCEQGLSLLQIARWLNDISAGGRQAWGTSQVGQILDRYDYAGIQIRGRMRQSKHRETGKIVTTERPRSEWQVRRVRHLQIIDWKTWKEARRRREERSSLFPEGSRGRVATYPTRLLTLVCGCCGASLVLGKSGRYAQVRCPNAAEGKQGCKFGGYKSLKKIETPILKLVAERLADPDLIDQLVLEANTAIEELARLPQPDLVSIEARIAELKAAEKRLLEAIEGSDAAVAVLAPRLEENQRRLEETRNQLADARSAAAGPPEPLTTAAVHRMLSDLQGLLADVATVAAPVLHDLLGDVIVTQQNEPGVEKPVWYAEFQFDALYAARRLDRSATRSTMNGPKGAIEGDRVTSGRERIRIDPPPVHQKPKKVPPYIRIAEDAARLRDEGLTFAEIGQRLCVHEVTAMRACDHARPEARPRKGQKRTQGGKAAQVRRQLAELLAAGLSTAEAAAQAGCSAMTAYRVQKELSERGASAGSEAA